MYIESVRILDVDGHIDESKTINGLVGFSELLDMFPLVNEITLRDDDRLVTPPRFLDTRPTQKPSAVFYVTVVAHGNEAGLSPFGPMYLTLRNYNVNVVYTVYVADDCSVDWDLSTWERLGTSRSPLLLPGITRSSQVNREVPFSLICNRNIRYMSILHPVDLDVLSQHLKQRQRMGWEDIKEWDFPVISLSAFPKFLHQNRQVTRIVIRETARQPISINGFLCLDWSIFKGNNEDLAIRHLDCEININHPCDPEIEARLEKVIDTLNPLAPLLPLESFTFRLTMYNFADISTFPPFSQIAKLLVRLTGYKCRIVVEFDDRADHDDRSFRDSVRSQLIKEVEARQSKEVRRNKEKKGHYMTEVPSMSQELDVVER